MHAQQIRNYNCSNLFTSPERERSLAQLQAHSSIVLPYTLMSSGATLHQLRQAMAQWHSSAKSTYQCGALAAVMGSVRSHTASQAGDWSTLTDVVDNDALHSFIEDQAMHEHEARRLKVLVADHVDWVVNKIRMEVNRDIYSFNQSKE